VVSHSGTLGITHSYLERGRTSGYIEPFGMVILLPPGNKHEAMEVASAGPVGPFVERLRSPPSRLVSN
jgi:hypothetical protein